MLIPLWLPWSVAAALVLTGFFATVERRGEQAWDGGRTPGPAFLGRTFAASLVAVVVAAGLTLDRQRVDEEELHEAVAAAAAEADGGLGNVSLARVAQGATDRLGRRVALGSVGAGRQDSGRLVQDHEARLVDDDEGPVACLEVTVDTVASNPGLGLVGLDVDRGRC